MNIFSLFTLCGGLAFFLYGMTVMSKSLEKMAGGRLERLLKRMTSTPIKSLLLGAGITIAIQSSSAMTVMLVGLVNSGVMELGQTIGVIMGSNIGTTLTAWLLSLTGIESESFFVNFLKPKNFSPLLALAGILLIMGSKKQRRRDVGRVMMGFSILMYGMELMSGAVAPLADMPEFADLMTAFTNPLLGVLVGAAFTGIIQSSAASVGILQALAMTGSVTYGMAIPIIMGQNIGTCVTALISSVGANKNAKRAAMVHLSFNVIGTAVWLTVFCLVKAIFAPALLQESTSLMGIAVAHSLFNLLCTLLMLPLSQWLEALVCKLVPDSKQPEVASELDERLLAAPAVALERCRKGAADMATTSVRALNQGITALTDFTPETAKQVQEEEDKTDHLEDILGTYLVKLSTRRISADDSNEAARLLKIIGDFERIADHAVNLVHSSEELQQKKMELSAPALAELKVLTNAVSEILSLSLDAFLKDDLQSAVMVEPLEQVIDGLKEQLRTNHILRLQKEQCSIEAGFVWSDMLTDLERVSDHCSNIAGCIMDMHEGKLNLHESLRAMKEDREKFADRYALYQEKYKLA